jgi:hypothetical protein
MMDNDIQQKMDALMGINIDKPIIKVRHSFLLRTGTESLYRSQCPVCELGAMLVGRDTVGGNLVSKDRCILCAQEFEYVDIDEVEEQDPDTIIKWEEFKTSAVNYDELHVYCAIDELGAIIWRLNHSMHHGHISRDDMDGVHGDINYMHKMSGFLFKLTKKFGIRIGNDIAPTESYRRWYAWWKKYFTDMTNDEWRQFEIDLSNNNTKGYRPIGDWRTDQDLKFKQFNFILGEV